MPCTARLRVRAGVYKSVDISVDNAVYWIMEARLFRCCVLLDAPAGLESVGQQSGMHERMRMTAPVVLLCAAKLSSKITERLRKPLSLIHSVYAAACSIRRPSTGLTYSSSMNRR